MSIIYSAEVYLILSEIENIRLILIIKARGR